MIALAVALQLLATSTPASGDTVGYWQQRVNYRITATLDEASETLHASGTLVYVNNSPDTLRELYFHQYLNAFRPYSKWSEADEREGRVRFQNLDDPDYGFERFTAPIEIQAGSSNAWTAVSPTYPGALDSTVVHVSLPQPMSPGDSLTVRFAWDARVSTVIRRQGRRGRHYDFAQWFPKVAVYDRGGWQPNAFMPAGELYGEFGTYDVTLVVRDDQIIGATGVPVSGDPGWERVRRWGVVFPASRPNMRDPAATVVVPDGHKAVRWIAENVHHFAWSVSPDYRYEGAGYISEGGSGGDGRIPTFDTVAIHVLYRPGDEPTWGNGQVVQRAASALRWLERLYGPYAWPQLTSLHRLDGGGTEFPMVMMNGSPSVGLNLHEGGHMYSYGLLANNEWRSGWMDEGLTSYQTSWAQGLTAHERAKRPPVAAPIEGYRRHAIVPWRHEATQMDQYRLDFTGRAQPIGTAAYDFNEFGIYNAMIYTRAEMMYGALRDVMGDSAFTRFLRDYYRHWALRHVDELAMRASAERAYGKPLGWFFDQWVHRTGVIDYGLEDVRIRRDNDGWLTSALVVKHGEYSHPMPFGVRTASGWVTVRGDPLLERQTLTIRTASLPIDVRLDPQHVTEDWDRRNDVRAGLLSSPASKIIPAWPFLKHVDRNRSIVTASPELWYSDPGGATVGARFRSSYQGWIDRQDIGIAYTSRRRPENAFAFEGDGESNVPPLRRLQGWAVAENPRVFGDSRPSVGLRTGIWFLDGVFKVDARKRWNDDLFAIAKEGRTGHRTLALTGTFVYDDAWPDVRRWSSRNTLDLSLEYETRPSPKLSSVRALFDIGLRDLFQTDGSSEMSAFTRVELESKGKRVSGKDDRREVASRAFLGWNFNVPMERSTLVSSANPTETFENNYVRPRGGVLAPPAHPERAVRYLVPGGAYLRGYDPFLRVSGIVASNVEQSVRLTQSLPTSRIPELWGSAFVDLGLPLGDTFGGWDSALADAGVGLALRGRMYDRDYRVRFDVPIYVKRAFRTQEPTEREIGLRLVVSSRDVW